MSTNEINQNILVRQGDAALLFKGHQILKGNIALPWGKLCYAAYKTDNNKFVVAVEFYDSAKDKCTSEYRVFDTVEAAVDFCANSKEAVEICLNAIHSAEMQ